MRARTLPSAGPAALGPKEADTLPRSTPNVGVHSFPGCRRAIPCEKGTWEFTALATKRHSASDREKRPGRQLSARMDFVGVPALAAGAPVLAAAGQRLRGINPVSNFRLKPGLRLGGASEVKWGICFRGAVSHAGCGTVSWPVNLIAQSR